MTEPLTAKTANEALRHYHGIAIGNKLLAKSH
jgi:hypothetical protein